MAVNPQAKELYKQGRELTKDRLFIEAISSYEDAVKLAPEWPEPLFEIAFNYLIQQKFADALEFYHKVDELKPEGYFTTKTAIWGLEKEKENEFPAGLYVAYAQIEWTINDTRRLEILEEITESFPDYAPAWSSLADELEQPDDIMYAIENGLKCFDMDLETQGKLLISKALVTQMMGNPAKAKKQLEGLKEMPLSQTNRETVDFVLSTMD